MVNNRIFVSKRLPEDLKSDAQALGYVILDDPMLNISLEYSQDTAQSILKLYDQVIEIAITSAHAIEALKKILPNEASAPINWKYFTISGATRKAIIDWYGHDNNIIAADKSIRDLLKHMPSTQSHIFHICGDHFRPELDKYCSDNSIHLHRYIVYKSEKNVVQLDDVCSAYLFCSPRSVEVFMEANKLHNNAVTISIGPSTTEKLKEYHINNIIESEHPSLQDMLTTYYQYDKK